MTVEEKFCISNKYFGTDGFRGEAGVDLTSSQAYRVGRFLGWYYASAPFGAERGAYRPRVVIGKDTRRSSYTLEYAIAAGLTASGADAYILHVTTTPSVSYVVSKDGFDCGIMITASHNSFSDNGIKIINRCGEKIDDATASLIEAYIDGDLERLGLECEPPFASGERIGRIVDYVAGRNRYVAYLISLASHSYKHLRIGLDTANGASWSIASAVFEALGARVYTLGAEPDGLNINEGCGSTAPERLQRLVREEHLDLGFAFDGDGDRCIAIDERGEIVDGDGILYVLAKRLRARGMLSGNAVVSTVMSNGGLAASLRAIGIENVETAVGDRFVYEAMQRGDFALGGEHSGHVIIKKYATSGDGLLTAIMLCEELCDRKAPLSSLCRGLRLYPQVTLNLRVTDRDAASIDREVLEVLSDVEGQLRGNGRVVLRKSGTEPMLRIKVECDSERECREYAQRIAEKVEERGYLRK